MKVQQFDALLVGAGYSRFYDPKKCWIRDCMSRCDAADEVNEHGIGSVILGRCRSRHQPTELRKASLKSLLATLLQASDFRRMGITFDSSELVLPPVTSFHSPFSGSFQVLPAARNLGSIARLLQMQVACSL